MPPPGPATPARTSLLERLAGAGLEVSFALTGDAYLSGAREGRSGALALAEAGVALDTAAAGLWRGGRAVVVGQWIGGRGPSASLGDAQVVSNIEMTPGARLSEVYLEQTFAGGRGRVALGRQDITAHLAVLEHGAVFVNSSFGLSPEFAQVGPSTAPATFPGLTAGWAARRGAYVEAAAFAHLDRAAAPPGTASSGACGDDGRFYAAEAGWSRPVSDGAPHAKFGLGGWHHARCYERPGAAPAEGNSGVYALAEGRLPLSLGAAGGLDAFVHGGVANGDRNAIRQYVGAGVAARGVFRSRPDDVLGFGVATARPSGRDVPGASLPGLAAESSLELTYRVALREGLALQPDVQYVVRPGFAATRPRAWVFVLRTDLSF